MQLPRVQEATENIETSTQVLLRQPKASVFVCKESETIPHRCNAVSAFGIFFNKRSRGRYTFFFHFTFDGAHSSVFRNLHNIDFISSICRSGFWSRELTRTYPTSMIVLFESLLNSFVHYDKNNSKMTHFQ